MRDSHGFDALFTQVIHPVPKSLRVLTVETRKRHGGQFIGTPEDHIAVKVAAVIGRTGVFISNKGGEFPGVIKAFGGFDRVGPGRAGDVIKQFLLNGTVGDAYQVVAQKCTEGFNSIGISPGHLIFRCI